VERHFTSEDIRKLTDAEREFVLSEQAEALRHAQEQGQKLFRILIAVSALMLALSGTEIYTVVANNEELYQLFT
jgi:cytochrome b subunit of formate dehydrogenase